MWLTNGNEHFQCKIFISIKITNRVTSWKYPTSLICLPGKALEEKEDESDEEEEDSYEYDAENGKLWIKQFLLLIPFKFKSEAIHNSLIGIRLGFWL